MSHSEPRFRQPKSLISTALAALVLTSLGWSQDLLVAAARPTANSNWPQWRGPDRDGISKESGWSVEGKPESLWVKGIGMGYSTVSIVDGRLYTQGHDKEKQEDTIFCLDAMTGEEIWTHRFPAKTWAKAHAGGTLATPSVDGPRVFASNREGNMFCFDAKSGEILWHKNLVEEFELKLPQWGFAASPLVLDDMIVMNVGHVIAFDRKGKVIWKTKENYGDCYSTPVDFTFKQKACLATFSATGLVVLDRKSGKELEKYEWKTRYDVNAATPVVIGDKVFISSGYNHGCAMVQLTGKEPKLLWESKVMRNHMSGCVLYENHLYGFDEGTVKCLDLDGEEKWAQRGLGKGALVIADGKLLMLSSKGELVIAEATAEEYRELSRAKVTPGGVNWTTPVLLNGLIYCRNSVGDLVCRDHRGDTK